MPTCLLMPSLSLFYQPGRWTFLCYQIGPYRSWTSKQCPPAKWQRVTIFFLYLIQVWNPFSFVFWVLISHVTLITGPLIGRPALLCLVTVYRQQTTPKRKLVCCSSHFSFLNYGLYVRCVSLLAASCCWENTGYVGYVSLRKQDVRHD